MEKNDIVQLAGNVADWLHHVHTLSAEEIAAVGQALCRHAACLAREDVPMPGALEDDRPSVRFATPPVGNPLNN